MKRFCAALWLAASMATGCSVKVIEAPPAPEITANSCVRDRDCMSGASCREGVCFAATSPVEQVVLEIVPEADSPSGGLTYIATLDDVANGGKRDITLPRLARFIMQVQLNPDEAARCGYPRTTVTIPARVEFNRISSVAGAPIIGLPSRPMTAVTVSNPSRTGWNASLALVPGTYDVYIAPSPDRCALAPRLLRGIEVPEEVAGWAVPATLNLPAPAELSGLMQRRGGTLAGWKVDVIDAQDGRVLSTTATLGATNATDDTNFMLQYQPVSSPKANSAGATATLAAGTSALLRVTPPDNVAAPTVYWDLAVADLNGTGKLDLDLSAIPNPDQLVRVEGRVQGAGNDVGAPASLRFTSTALTGAMALTATFKRTVKTDAEGRYTVDLLPGDYRVVSSPTAMVWDSGPHPPTAPSTVPWAVTETRVTIARPPAQPLVLRLAPKRVLRGTGLAGPEGDPALGATFDANPSLFAEDFGVLRGALAQTAVVPQGMSVTLSDRGAFTLPLDPGRFDLTLRPKEGSNFAWWVAPGITISSPTNASDVMMLSPQLPLPVAIEGTIVTPADSGSSNAAAGGLSNAAVRVYARAPKGSAVTRVAEARTDGRGRYRLSLPSTFGNP